MKITSGWPERLGISVNDFITRLNYIIEDIVRKKGSKAASNSLAAKFTFGPNAPGLCALIYAA
jgi:hypothetical protein